MASCKTFCKSRSVDGTGSVSASMRNTVGLDLMNFINPELTWNKIAKGSRSASRRSRKPVGRSLKPAVELAGKSSKIVWEASVSESEKLGVAVHGRRFGDKIENVPIKKRRLILWSPSPPSRTPSLLSKESEQFVATQCTSARRSYPNLIAPQQEIGSDSTFAKFVHVVDNVKIQLETDQKSDYSEDLSGIEILAAAACNNSMGDTFENAEEVPVVEDLSALEGSDSSTSTSAIPLKETIESLDAPNHFQGEQMEGVSPSVSVLHDLPPDEDEGTLKKSVASRVDRSHWDLNTIMDTWEQTCDEQIVNSQKDVLEGNYCDVMQNKKLENSERCEMQRNIADTQPGTDRMAQPMAGEVVSGEVHEDVHMLADSRCQCNGNNRLDGDEHKFEACPSSNESCLQGTVIPTLAENAMKKSAFIVAVANASPQVVSMDTCSWISEGNENAESGNGIIKHEKGYYDLESPLDDSCDSDVSQDYHGNAVSIENETKLQEVYDSQYEDGELRESDVYCWQENETEDEEAEQVDYASDNGCTYDFDAVDNAVSVSGKVEVGAECEKHSFFGSGHYDCNDKINMVKAVSDDTCQHYLGGSLDVTEAELSKRESIKASNMQLKKHFTEKNDSEKNETNIRVENGLSGESGDVILKVKHSTGGQDLKESSQSVSSQLKHSGWYQFPDGSGVSSSDTTAEIDDGKFSVPRANQRELPSCAEAPLSSAGIDRKDTQIMQRSRSTNLDDSYPHFEGVTSSDKLMQSGRSPLHMHDRSRGGGCWVDHSAHEWDSKRHHSYRYYGPYDAEHPGPKSVTVNSKGAYRHAIRRSPADRDAAYGMSTEMAPIREIGTNSRSRSGRYAQGFGRGTRIPRNGYHEPMLDDTESAVRMPYYIARREGTFSRNHSREAPPFLQPRKRSRSRTRSHSPQVWLLEKERNVGLRQFSRSPDFRSKARMDRARFPFQKHSFGADYDAGFMSPPRNRFSSQQNTRWTDDGNCAVEHFRDRRSPVRMFRQRFDSAGVPGGLKSDGYFRPMIRPGRSVDIAAAAAGRERRYEGGDEYKRKYGDRFETHPGRHYDGDGFVRRIRYDAKSGGVARSSQYNKDDCVRGPERRQMDIPPRREEKGQLRNNHDRYVRLGTEAIWNAGM